MSRIKIKVVKLGHLDADFGEKDILAHQSKVFELIDGIDAHHLSVNADLPEWAYSDKSLSHAAPKRGNEDILVVLTNVPLEDNFYARRLGDNRAVVTFFYTQALLENFSIPLKNFVYRVLYAYSLIYLRSKHKDLEFHELKNFTHDETRGCLFDMNGIKADLRFSCARPIICDDCVQRLRNEGVSEGTIFNVKHELRGVKKELFYLIFDFIKMHPIWALIISSSWAFILNVLATLFMDWIRK